MWKLTFSAVLPLPAWIADLLPTLSTREVPKGIVPGATEDRAAFPVVVLIAHKTVGILEVSASTAVQVLGPFFPNRQMPLGSQAANETLWVLCKRGGGGEGMAMPLVKQKGRGYSWEATKGQDCYDSVKRFNLGGQKLSLNWLPSTHILSTDGKVPRMPIGPGAR